MSLYPLEFEPILQDYIWGGQRLNRILGKPAAGRQRIAESWEVVDHHEHQSIVAQGPLRGKTLAELIRSDPQGLLGRHASFGSFPLLLKYLDCNRVLSVQVHPDDAYAKQMSPPDLGKTEAWYIVEADPGSVIYAGLADGVTRADLERAVKAGETEQLLHRLHPQPGDCIFIPAGTVHALGAGLLVAEIQQASNTTFRLFDWNRVDADGQPRPLHVESALEVTDYQRGPVFPQTPEAAVDGWEPLVACDKFMLRRHRGAEPVSLPLEQRFKILTVPTGSAELAWNDQVFQLPRGRSLLLPAALERVQVQPNEAETTLLCMFLPD